MAKVIMARWSRMNRVAPRGFKKRVSAMRRRREKIVAACRKRHPNSHARGGIFYRCVMRGLIKHNL